MQILMRFILLKVDEIAILEIRNNKVLCVTCWGSQVHRQPTKAFCRLEGMNSLRCEP